MAADTASSPIVLDAEERGPGELGEHQTDSVVKLAGLVNAAHLNGQFAIVLRYVPDKARYEVGLHPGGEKKSLKPDNLEQLPLLEEVALLRDRLASPGVPVSVALPALRRLEALDITTEVLRQTLVGKVVNEVSRSLANLDEIASIGKRLVVRWRDMYRLEQAAERQAAERQASAERMEAPPAAAAAAAPAPDAFFAAPPRQAATVRTGLDQPVPKIQREPKRARIVEEAVREDTVMEAAPAAQSPPVDVDMGEEVCPPELADLDPAYASMLMMNPRIKAFLLKHPHVMKNLNADNVKFLIRGVMRSGRNGSSSPDNTLQEAGSAAGRALTISNLPPDATESDISLLLARSGAGPADISLARESRYRRSCGVAFAILSSREAAEEALIELQGAVLHGHRIRVECAGSLGANNGAQGREDGRRIAWKDDDDLFEVALYDRWESVLDFRDRCHNHTANGSPVPGELPEDAARFSQAAMHERAEKATRVREALGGVS